jgi:spore maturation protein CgeB
MKVILSQWAMSASHYYIPNSEKRYDVSFIGQKHGIRQAIMDVLWANDLKVHKWGDFWVNDPFYHGRLREVGDVVGVMNCSKINLNLQNPWAISTSSQIKGRIMQIPACRAFQLCTPAPCVEDYFIPDKEIVIANDMNELVDKARYYLTHDKEREEIAEAGYQRCLREHTWENRMSKILGELNG